MSTNGTGGGGGLARCIFSDPDELSGRAQRLIQAAYLQAMPHDCNGVVVGLLLAAAGFLTSEFNLKEGIPPTPRTKTDAELEAIFDGLSISDLSALFSRVSTALLDKDLHNGEGHTHG